MTGNNKVWRAPLAGLASVAMLATMGVAAGTANADAAAGVDPYDYTVTLHVNAPSLTSGAKLTYGSQSGSSVTIKGSDLDNADGTKDSKFTDLYDSAAGYTITEPTVRPGDKDWTFTGWYTSPEYGSEKFDFKNTTVTKNIDLYAHWAESDQLVSLQFAKSSLYDNTKSAYYGQNFNINAAGSNSASTPLRFYWFASNAYVLNVAKQDKKIAAWELPADNAGDGYVVDTWKVGPTGQDLTDTVTLDQLTKDFTGKLSYQDTGEYDVTLDPEQGKQNATIVSYYDNKGFVYGPVDVKYGESVSTTPNTEKYGYLTATWEYNDYASGKPVTLTDSFKANDNYKNLKLTAAGSSTSVFPVTYYTEVAGTWDTVVATEYVAANASPKGSVTPSRSSDYTFRGWSTTPDYNAATVSLSSLKITKATPLYAQWSTNKVTVTFDYNYAGKTEPKSYQSGENYSFTAPTAKRDGYQFLGWYYANDSVDPETGASKSNSNPFASGAEFVKAFVKDDKGNLTKNVDWASDRDSTTGGISATGKWLKDYEATKISAGSKLQITKDGKLQYLYYYTVANPDAKNGVDTKSKWVYVPSTLYAAWGKLNGSDLHNQEQSGGYTLNDANEIVDSTNNYTKASK
ncbi:InlB B-repeat-containing protein, partial [Bifidobacterium amazonense]